MTYRIYRYSGDSRVLVGFGYRTIDAAECAQARMYANRTDDDDADFMIE